MQDTNSYYTAKDIANEEIMRTKKMSDNTKQQIIIIIIESTGIDEIQLNGEQVTTKRNK